MQKKPLPTKKPVAMMREWSRRRTMAFIATPIVLLIVLASAYLLYANGQTEAMKQQVAQRKSTQATMLQKFAKTYTSLKDSERAAAIATTSAQLPPLHCDTPTLLYPPLAEAIQHCVSFMNKQQSFRNNLDVAAKMVTYDGAVKAALKKASDIDVQSNASWQQRRVGWQQAQTSLQKTSAAPGLTKAHTQLVAEVTKLAKTWQVLEKADKEQKLNDLTAAKKQLAARYDALRKLAIAYENAYSDLQTELYMSRKAL